MSGDLVRDGSRYLVAYAILAAVEVARVPIATAFLTPAEYGNFALAFTSAGLLALLSVTWLTSTIVRFYPIEAPPGAVGLAPVFIRAAGGAVAAGLVVGGLAGAAGLALGWIPDATAVLAVLAVFLALATDRLILAVCRAARRPTVYLAYAAGQSLLGLAIGSWLVIDRGVGYQGFLWGLAAASTVAAVAAVPLIVREARAGRTGAPAAAEIARFGWPIVAINGLTWVLSGADRYLIEAFRSSAEVGLYSAVYLLAEKPPFVITYVISLAAGPILFRIGAVAGDRAAGDYLGTVARAYLILSLPVLAGLIAGAPTIVGLLLPADYQPVTWILPIVATGAWALGLANVYTEAFTLARRTADLMLAYLVAGAINLALNLWLIPGFGLVAAAGNTLIGYLAFLIVTLVWSRRLVPWSFPARTAVRATVAALGLGGAVYLIAGPLGATSLPGLIAAGAAGLAIYVGLLISLGEITPADRRAVAALIPGGSRADRRGGRDDS